MSSGNLSVYLSGKHAGTLRRTRNGARFSFCERVAQQYAGSPMLSCALPVQAAEFDAEQTRRWFLGLLPEEGRLDEVRRFYGIPSGTYLDVLEEIGWECAGAVAVLSEGRAPLSHTDTANTPITDSELANRLNALPSHPFDTRETMRMSLGGFQEKLCVIAPDARMAHGKALLGPVSLSENGAPTTHILKPQPDRFPGMIRAEAWGMAVAAHATRTAETALLASTDLSAPETLVVKRFDRTTVHGKTIRMHQEDCCQALGLDTMQKYAAESVPTKSDPTFKSIARLLIAYSLDPLEELKRLFEQMCVNVALGNTDAHAKNYALLHRENSISLSPLYDVVPALEITPGILAMGMRINGKIRIDRIMRADLIAEGSSWGLSAKLCNGLLDTTLERLRVGAAEVREIYPLAAERHERPALTRIERLDHE